ncbi:MAG: site-specific DNA-methyltransferase [Candidatus Paceibacterota bacterium]
MNATLATLQSKSAKGTIWQIGNHRIACGDARDTELLRRLFNGQKAKAAICDVPYGISYTASKLGFADILVKKDIANDGITDEREYAKFNEEWLLALIPHLATKNAVYVFNSDRMIFALHEGFRRAGVRFAQLIVWVKNQPVIGRMDYLPQHELIAYGWYGTHKFMRAKDKSVLFYPRPHKSRFHPTQKPVALVKNLVLNSTRVGDIVFDGFLGAGTTALACEETKRICYGVELDSEYCDVLVSRFEDRYGIKAVNSDCV